MAGGSDGPTIHTVFSAESGGYHRWQARLLEHSHRRAGQAGPLTCVVSGLEDPTPVLERTFFAARGSPRPGSGDSYAPYNKPTGLGQWLRESLPKEETILIVDPDCVFLSPIVPRVVARGRPLAQPVYYLDFRCGLRTEIRPTCDWPSGYWEPYHLAARRYCSRPDSVQGVGIPIIIHRDDLAALAPLWLEKTEAIRADPELRDRIGWIVEMWGYCLAAAELGLDHELVDLGCFSTEDRDDLPIVHYCYDSHDRKGEWSWSKKRYRPFDEIPAPPAGVPRATVGLIRLINELATASRCP